MTGPVLPDVHRELGAGTALLWEAGVLGEAAPGPEIFDMAYWQACGRLVGWATGRGEAGFLDAGAEDTWVLRHFRRGGLIARISRDRYLGPANETSRSLKEFRMLAALVSRGLPVPWPVAARSQAGPAFVYRADLITRRIPGAEPLAELLMRVPVESAIWEALGHQIAVFHAAGVCHADLNARNILLDTNNQFWLIDFDRARHRASTRSTWRAANLARLRRSLDKFAVQEPVFHFTEADWRALKTGYARVFDERL